jgi:prepilin-type N-terminal cleavage/methylation domain-containing protein
LHSLGLEASVTRSRTRRGFTLIELMVVVVIVGVAAAMSVALFGRQRQRQQVDQFALEMRALLVGARQVAMSTGTPVALLVFPNFVTPTGTGRLILYRDGNFSLFSAAAPVNLQNLDAAAPVADTRSEVLETIDLADGLVIGPATGQGPAAVMPAPFNGIAINRACPFCTGAAGLGAMVFMPNGSVTFQDRNGPPLALPQGASISVTKPESQEIRTITVAASTGAMLTLKWNPTP